VQPFEPQRPAAWPGCDRAFTFLAPLEGITHPAFRALVARRGGVGVVCTEFVRINSSGVGARYLQRQVVRTPDAALSVQVMGNHLEHMAKATEIVSRAGADIVDLNVGCPAPRVVRKGVGSAMLRDPELLARVVGTMRAHTPGFLSAKMRAGFDDSGGAVRIARLLEASGADLITVHPRRRSDFFGGVADWRIIAQIKAAVRIPVIGNGDVWYASDALRLRAETGADGVMIGRGALRNPWIFAQIDALLRGTAPPCPNGNDVLAHQDELRELFEQEQHAHPLGMLKEQIRYLCRSLPDGAGVMRRALRSETCDELRAVLAERLQGEPAESLDLGAEGGTLEQRPSSDGAAQPNPASYPPSSIASAAAVTDSGRAQSSITASSSVCVVPTLAS
jgi:nifR3 family TIM-barrel protein